MADAYWGGNSLSSSPFTTIFTPGSISENSSGRYADYDFVDTLALAQRLGVHFLPIAWQAPYQLLGRGGQATINQALVNLQTSFAFKSYRLDATGSESPMRGIINEMIALSRPAVRMHPHIVELQGLCWEVSPSGKVSPVLVFEKAHFGDLSRFFASVGGGSDLSLEDRLDMCADIGIAVRDMHSQGTRNPLLPWEVSS